MNAESFEQLEKQFEPQIRATVADLLKGVPKDGGVVNRATLASLISTSYMGGVVECLTREGKRRDSTHASATDFVSGKPLEEVAQHMERELAEAADTMIGGYSPNGSVSLKVVELEGIFRAAFFAGALAEQKLNPWIFVEDDRPDNFPDGEKTVDIWVPGDEVEPVWVGFFDGENWRTQEGLVIEQRVAAFRDRPQPPKEGR